MFKLPVKFIYMRREAALTLLNMLSLLSLVHTCGCLFLSLSLALYPRLGPAPVLGHLDRTSWMSLVLVCSCLYFSALGLDLLEWQ